MDAAADPDPLVEEVRAVGLGAGLDAVGVAPADAFRSTAATLEQRKGDGLHGGMQFTYRNPARSTEPARALPGAASLVVGARSYRRRDAGADGHRGARAGGDASGRVARYSWIDHYAPLRRALGEVADHLVARGWRATVLVDDNALVDREAAFRAGIGWYGKNTMLLLPGHGSEFVLGSVVTDAPLAPTSPRRDPADAAAAGCGTCVRCLPACPTGALVEPGVLDARRCLAWLLQAEGPFPVEHRVALGDRIYGCDECQDACPPNRLEIRRRPPPPPEPGAEPSVPLLELLGEDDDGVLLDRHRRWYVPRRDARYLRRNALVALGNVGRGSDPAVAAALARHLASEDALVRAHAVWASARLGRLDLVAAATAAEDDPLVLSELGALPPPRQA